MKIPFTLAASAVLVVMSSSVLRAEPQAGQSPSPGAHPAAAQDPGSNDPKAMAAHFVKEAADGNMLEVKIAELASQRVKSPQLKEFAEHLRQDHSKANEKLQQVAQSMQVALPTELSPVAQAKLSHLEKMQGEHFEKHFLYGQVGHHVTDVLMYRDAANSMQDAPLKQYAQETLAAIQHHLQVAQGLANWDEARPASATEHPAGQQNHDGATAVPDRQSNGQTNGTSPRTGTEGGAPR